MYTINEISKNINNSWLNIMTPEFNKQYFIDNLNSINKDTIVYPPPNDVLNAFKYFNYNDTKVCLLGMDPYINPNQAVGLSFSVNKSIPYKNIPPSLKNIFKERKNDVNIDLPLNGDLINWCNQGVLLLNTGLTVKEKKSGSHIKYWQEFTDHIIKELNKLPYVVFILLGNKAIDKIKLIDVNKHGIIKAGHPSPLNSKNDFFGSKIFSRTNELLKEHNILEINWNN